MLRLLICQNTRSARLCHTGFKFKPKGLMILYLRGSPELASLYACAGLAGRLRWLAFVGLDRDDDMRACFGLLPSLLFGPRKGVGFRKKSYLKHDITRPKNFP